MCRQHGGVETAAPDQGKQLRDGPRVHQASGDRDVLDPELLQVKGHGLAMYPYVGERSTGSDQLRGELERGRNADRLDSDVGTKAARQLEDSLDRILAAVVDRDVSAELPRLGEAGVVEVDDDDLRGRVELRGHDRRQSDRTCADDGHGVARSHAAVLDADLERSRKNVGEEQDLLVSES